MEQYHVPQTHPQLLPVRSHRPDDRRRSNPLIDAELHYLRTMSEGMAGMVHANDVRIAEGLRDMELPADPPQAMATWHRALNDAVRAWHRARGCDIPDLNELDAARRLRADGLLLPALLRAAACTAAPRPTASARLGRRRR